MVVKDCWNTAGAEDLRKNQCTYLQRFEFQNTVCYRLPLRRKHQEKATKGPHVWLASYKSELKRLQEPGGEEENGKAFRCCASLYKSAFEFTVEQQSLFGSQRAAVPTHVLPSGASCKPGDGHWHRTSPFITSQPYWQLAILHVRASETHTTKERKEGDMIATVNVTNIKRKAIQTRTSRFCLTCIQMYFGYFTWF